MCEKECQKDFPHFQQNACSGISFQNCALTTICKKVIDPQKQAKKLYTILVPKIWRIFSQDIEQWNTFLTWVILPNRVTEFARRRWGVGPPAPLAFRVLCKRKSKVEVLDSQYASTSLFSCVCNSLNWSPFKSHSKYTKETGRLWHWEGISYFNRSANSLDDAVKYISPLSLKWVPLEQRLVKNASSHRTVVAESNILHYTDKKCVLIFLPSQITQSEVWRQFGLYVQPTV